MRRKNKQGAKEEIPWKLPDIVESIKPSTDDIILNYVQKNKIVATIFLQDELHSSTCSKHLLTLCKEGKIKDLGFRNVKLKNARMTHAIHLFGVADGSRS